MVVYSLLNTSIHMGRSHIKQVAEKRRVEIQNFLNTLFQMAPEVSHSDLVYTFFHPLLRDQQEASIEDSKLKGTFPDFIIIIKSIKKLKILD